MEQTKKYIYRDIFRAIHEGKWLSIEYCNKEQQITKYWIGILKLDPYKGTLKVDGLHLGRYKTDTFDTIYIDSIVSSRIVEGSFCPVNRQLAEDIYLNPHKYKNLFDHAANLKILNYLEMCNRMDTVPYYSDFMLVHFLDRESFGGEDYELSDAQFQAIVKSFQYKLDEKDRRDGKIRIQQIAMNVLSLHMKEGLYVLAYKKLQLDVKRRVLHPDDEITVCTEYTLEGKRYSARKFLDAEEYELLRDFAHNQEKIKDCITRHNRQVTGVDDMPYLIGLGMDVVLDLHWEYESILKMYREGKATEPIKAFFGDLLSRPVRRKAYPITLINHKINLDQLLAIHNAMKYPVAYIQGPPGTGKTNTIINTIITAFFNEKTVLFASYNNHPINGVVEKLTGMEYRGRTIPFPVLRLGNSDKVKEALSYMKALYEQTRNITVYESTLDRNKGSRAEHARQLSQLLKKYEEILDLKERGETLERMLEYDEKHHSLQYQMLPFRTDLKGRQLQQVNRLIRENGTISDEDALSLLEDDEEELKKYLYYTSARYLKRIDEPKNKDLKTIIFTEDEEAQAAGFTKYLGKKENLKKLQRIFPIIATTCISAHRLGDPEPMFDMVIMDEASQCNNAVSLVPIIRGENLMLVGDPQQLNPVILLDDLTNRQLRKKYYVTEEYDYINNSIYKTFLACDAVSDEVLLRYHYRCHKKIIEFNNKKYYNSRLQVRSDCNTEQPLLFIDVQNNLSMAKNTAPAEVEAVLDYAVRNQEKSIGVITPFVNQKNLIEEAVGQKGLCNITCGTVHAFQGDEKDVVLFSTAITDNTYQGTYDWLKNNKELINVATSRAREKLVVLSSAKNLERLHRDEAEDDLYELVRYVRQNGESEVTQKKAYSRALGVKPFSTATEEAFLQNLNHALENIWLSQSRFAVHKEVAVSHVFQDNVNYNDLFYSGRFDFVVYERISGSEIPVLAIELDGKEHFNDEMVKLRDQKKNEICREHHLQIIRVENTYARRYNHIKDILINYFSMIH